MTQHFNPTHWAYAILISHFCYSTADKVYLWQFSHQNMEACFSVFLFLCEKNWKNCVTVIITAYMLREEWKLDRLNNSYWSRISQFMLMHSMVRVTCICSFESHWIIANWADIKCLNHNKVWCITQSSSMMAVKWYSIGIFVLMMLW